MTATTSP
jgi:hypothetical protein